MRIISEKALKEFWQNDTDAETVMREWIYLVRQADWKNSADVKQTFNTVNRVNSCFVFDVGGNKYRIIAKVAFRIRLVFIRNVLTHKEYDKDKWQADCS